MMLLQKAKDPAFWEKVRTNPAYKPMVDELFTLWEKDCQGDIPACKYSDYIQYNITGSRVEYERPYFVRRRAMNTAAILSLIYPEEEKYFAKLCDVLWAILDEYSWVLPAHIGNFTDNTVAFIDLFAAETGFALSEIDYLLAERLPPLIRSRIAAEIDRRIISAYMGTRRYWWERGTNNWAAVCAGSVGITYIYRHPEMFETVRPMLEETMRCFLSGFPEDGICLEGFGYWHYGFGFYLCFADLVQQFTNGKIDYLTQPKLREIVRFPQRMYLDNATTVSFSDGGMRGEWHLGMLHYLKKRFPADVQIPPRAYAYTNDGCGRWGLHLRAFFWFDETLENESVDAPNTDYAATSQWLIRKTPRYSFAAKGGNNAEPHNHNDIGSFIVTKHGEQILCDPGAGTYTKQYFSAQRYEYFQADSRGHSVPIIDGQKQCAGREHSADAAWNGDTFTLEMHRAYDIPALTQLTRTFSFTEDSVTLSDAFAFASDALPIVERFISRYPVEIADGCVKTDALTLIANAADVRVTKEDKFWCIDFILAPASTQFTIQIQA